MDSPLKGKILVASADLLDPNFARALVLIVQHDENGAMGLVLNRPLQTTVSEAWMQVSSVPYPNEDPLFQGGPCEGPLMLIHKNSAHAQLEISGGLFLSSDADDVRELVQDATEPAKFFVGYAGWTAMQLEAELAQGAWLVAEILHDHIFTTPEDLWNLMLKAARPTPMPAIDPRRIPPDPSVN